MIGLADKVAFLSRPAAYPPGVRRVEARETHMSWVFLTEDRVYKMKKPVRYPHLDYSTLARRRASCEEELRVNRRFSPEVYLRVLPLRLDRGRLALDGPGRTVDWLVEMLRLPAEHLMDARIAAGRLERDEVARLGDYLAGFYAAQPPLPEAGELYLGRLREALRLDGALLARPELSPGPAAARLVAAAEAALERAAPLIRDRARAGRIVEGHGDLRPEHVCLTEPPRIFDCLEFDRSYRILDPYDEIAYLGLECAVMGADWVGPLLVERLSRRLGDPPPASLLACYAALSGLTRARLCLAHLLDRPVRLPAKWRPLAQRYLSAAEARLSPAAP